MAKNPAVKALSLHRDRLVKLLVVMLALLGWLTALSVASWVALEQVYQQWRLAQEQQVSVYLPAATPGVSLDTLSTQLLAQVGVQNVSLLPEAEVRNLLAPYLGDEALLPLPKVMTLQITPQVAVKQLQAIVQQVVPDATVDDARDLLGQVALAVRIVQTGALVLALTTVLVVTLLVALTVRAGLQAQAFPLRVLQTIGATDQMLARLLMWQIWQRGLWGCAMAMMLGLAVVGALGLVWPTLHSYLGWPVWLAVGLAPMGVLGVAGVVTWVVARRVVRRGVMATV